MKRPVLWSRAALDDLKAQIAHIAAENPQAAKRTANRVLDTAASLGRIPTGRPGRVPDTYEKSVSRLPYVIAYAIVSGATEESVAILRVIRTARNWRKGEWPEG